MSGAWKPSILYTAKYPQIKNNDIFDMLYKILNLLYLVVQLLGKERFLVLTL